MLSRGLYPDPVLPSPPSTNPGTCPRRYYQTIVFPAHTSEGWCGVLVPIPTSQFGYVFKLAGVGDGFLPDRYVVRRRRGRRAMIGTGAAGKLAGSVFSGVDWRRIAHYHYCFSFAVLRENTGRKPTTFTGRSFYCCMCWGGLPSSLVLLLTNSLFDLVEKTKTEGYQTKV